jgi:TetR/AcrR family tetracycline transcriptional repressor
MRSSPQRPPALHLDQVVSAALELLDEVGLDGLTMRTLADRLGVRAASLYWHLRDKEELLGLLAEAINAQTALPIPGATWRAKVEAAAAEYRRVLLAHRDSARIVTGRFGPGPETMRRIEATLRIFVDAGFSLADAADAGYLVANFVPGFVAEESMARPAGPSDVEGAPARDAADDALVLPLGSAATGRLEFRSGVSTVTVHADPLLRDLCRLRFSGRSPDVAMEGGTVVVHQRHGRRRTGEVSLNATIPWTIELRDGVSRVTLDLSGLPLQELRLSGGVTETTITLPWPAGAVRVRLERGAQKVNVYRPAGVPASVHIQQGASRLRVDENQFGSLGGEIRWETPDYAGSSDRYDIEIGGGASRVTIDTTPVAAGSPPEDVRTAAPSPEPEQALRNLPADEFPTLAAMDARTLVGDMDQRFHFALEVILDGLEQRLERSRARVPS